MQSLKIIVLGAGTMGRGIAQVAATHGHQVDLVDANPKVLTDAQQAIAQSLDKLAHKNALLDQAPSVILSRIDHKSDAKVVASDADLIIEAVPENIAIKIELVRALTPAMKPDAIFASNTSSLSITEIAAQATRPERVVGLHFFNPVPLMELLEIVHGLATSADTLEKARAFGQGIGKQNIIVKDCAGFASSRLGVMLGCEAIRMLEQGVASAEDIDRAMELGYRHPMGPLKVTDLVGLDVRLAILEHLHKELGEQFRPPSLLRQMVRAGRLGRKSGEGFYRYTK